MARTVPPGFGAPKFRRQPTDLQRSKSAPAQLQSKPGNGARNKEVAVKFAKTMSQDYRKERQKWEKLEKQPQPKTGDAHHDAASENHHKKTTAHEARPAMERAGMRRVAAHGSASKYSSLAGDHRSAQKWDRRAAASKASSSAEMARWEAKGKHHEKELWGSISKKQEEMGHPYASTPRKHHEVLTDHSRSMTQRFYNKDDRARNLRQNHGGRDSDSEEDGPREVIGNVPRQQ